MMCRETKWRKPRQWFMLEANGSRLSSREAFRFFFCFWDLTQIENVQFRWSIGGNVDGRISNKVKRCSEDFVAPSQILNNALKAGDLRLP
jgi:hypothetical protein